MSKLAKSAMIYGLQIRASTTVCCMTFTVIYFVIDTINDLHFGFKVSYC